MKKGVGFGRVIRNGIIFVLAFLMFFGALSIIYEIVFENTDSNSIKTTTESDSTTQISNKSDETLSDDFKENELDVTSEVTDMSTESSFQDQSALPEEISKQSETTDETIANESTNVQSNVPSSYVENQNEYVGTICLTFDDGPSVEITNQILDILQEKNVKATFFILDYDDEKLNIINREIEDGHTVGLHGYSHDYSIIYSSLDSTTSNFVTLQEKLYADTGYYSNFIRFPGGSSNTVSKNYCTGIMTEATQAVTEMGFVYFDWNVDSQDAGGAQSAEEVYNNVTSTLVEGRTNVVLMHDASNKIYTLEALSSIIDYGLEHGFEFKAISLDTKVVHHNVNN